MTGTIKNINHDKGFCFIVGEDHVDYFMHSSSLKNGNFADLKRGQQVTFEDAEGPKGPRAEDVYV